MTVAARRIAVPLLAALFAVLGTIGPAGAAAADTGTGSVSGAVAHQAGGNAYFPNSYFIPDIPGTDAPTVDEGERIGGVIAATPFRTQNRWGDAANGFSSKYDGFMGSQLLDAATRHYHQGGAMTVGNQAHRITSGFTQFVVRLDVINGLGTTVDGIVNSILSAIIGFTGIGGGASLFGILAILVILTSIMRNAKYGVARAVREAGAIVVLVAIVFGLAATSLNHTPQHGSDYNPAPATPGWFVKGINDGITAISAAPAAIFMDNVVTSQWDDAIESGAGGGLGCTAYREALSAEYARSVRSDDPNANAQVAVSSAVDAMWDTTGLYTWAMTQAGYKNPYAAKVYCRILDMRAAIPVDAAYTTFIAAYNNVSDKNGLAQSVMMNAGSRAPFAPAGAEATAASIVAWAACRPTGFTGGSFTWSWEQGWADFQGGHERWPMNSRGWRLGDENPTTLCNQWWNATTQEASFGSSVSQDIPQQFFIKGEIGWLTDRVRDIPRPEQQQVLDFLVSITGVAPGGGTAGTIAYSIGAVIMAIAFFFINVPALIAKLLLVMFILALWFVLIGAAFRPAQMRERLVKTFNRFLGVAIFAAMVSIIVTFVVMITRALIKLGIDSWGAGELFTMVWSGLAPAAALIMVHLLFTKVFKLPSPISIRGAQAWSKAGVSGALGGAVGAAVGSYAGTRLGSLTTGAIRRAGSNITDSLSSKLTGGRLGGTGSRSTMAPGGGKSENLSADAEKADEGVLESQKPDRREQRRNDRQDLEDARSEYRAEHGHAAPGDIKGAISDKFRVLGGAIANRTGINSLRSELASRKESRELERKARKADVAERKALRDGITASGVSNMDDSAAKISDAFDSSGGSTKRENWGLPAGQTPPIVPKRDEIGRTMEGGGTRGASSAAEEAGPGVKPQTSLPAPPSNGPESSHSRAIQGIAKVLSMPADIAHGARRQAWRTQDATGAAVQDLVNSRAIQRAKTDAAIVISAVRHGIDTAKNTPEYQAARQAGERVSATVRKVSHGTSTAVRAVADRGKNNAALLDEYRARKEALQAANPAAPMGGEGNAPGGSREKEQ